MDTLLLPFPSHLLPHPYPMFSPLASSCSKNCLPILYYSLLLANKTQVSKNLSCLQPQGDPILCSRVNPD